MDKIVIIVDCQKDFIDGSLGTPEAQDMIPKLAEKIKYSDENTYFIFTADTHNDNYLNTAEGKKLPVKHCIKGTRGWEIPSCLTESFNNAPLVLEKSTFGSYDLVHFIEDLFEDELNFNKATYIENIEIEICGLCTDICVISNAILLKNAFPNNDIVINSKCCAGTTPEAHKAALAVMKNCQIEVV